MDLFKPHVFLDCDGVLADFDKMVMQEFGLEKREAGRAMDDGSFWKMAEEFPGGFFNQLELMPDALELFESVKHLEPTIITGCPRGKWAAPQKVSWTEKYFPGVPVITCRSKEKSLHMKAKGDILIDDWNKYRHIWIQEGGIFITHHDARTSLNALWAHYPELQSKN
jgi:5'(3')-deoxyribonucleotidase